MFPPINVNVNYGLTEVLYFNESLFDDGTFRYAYFAYNNSEHVTMRSAASIRIESPTELSPACTHPETNVTVAYVYTEENPLNVTVEFYNATHVVGVNVEVVDVLSGVKVVVLSYSVDGVVWVNVSMGRLWETSTMVRFHSFRMARLFLTR